MDASSARRGSMSIAILHIIVRGALKGDAKALAVALMSCKQNLPRGANKKSKHIGNIGSLEMCK